MGIGSSVGLHIPARGQRYKTESTPPANGLGWLDLELEVSNND